jgi:hypothetical protein
MEHIDLTQMVHDHQASLQAEAREHRLTKTDDEPVTREPRLRYERRHRNPAFRRQSLA